MRDGGGAGMTRDVERSTTRWAVASFFAGVAGLALVALALVAVCAGGTSVAFRQAFLAAAIVVVGCTLVVTVALDLLDERRRRGRLD